MAKKGQFNAAMEALLGADPTATPVETTEEATAPEAATSEPKPTKRPVGRPKTNAANYIHTSFIINEEQMEKIRFISYKENIPQKDIIEAALNYVIKNYEAKKGAIRPTQKKTTSREALTDLLLK